MAALWPVRVGVAVESTTVRAVVTAAEVDTRGHHDDLLAYTDYLASIVRAAERFGFTGADRGLV